MKVRFTETFHASPTVTYEKGKEYELEDIRARQFVGGRMAEPVDPMPPAPGESSPPAPAAAPRGRPGRKPNAETAPASTQTPGPDSAVIQ